MTSPDPEGLLAEQLLRLTRRVHRIQKRHLECRDLGITPAQSRLLRTLAHFGSPPRMADLAERLEVVPRAVTTLVDGLEASGRVRRVPDPANRRVIRIEVTEEGREALRELRQARRSAAEEILAPLTQEQRAALGGLLDVLMDGCAGGGAPGGARTEGVHGAARAGAAHDDAHGGGARDGGGPGDARGGGPAGGHRGVSGAGHGEAGHGG